MSFFMILFLCVCGFIGAFVDSIAGGGGIITVPAYMVAGLPPHMVLGTNKFASTMGSFTSSLKFFKSGYCEVSLLKRTIPFTLIGAFLGVKSVLLLDDSFLQPLVLILILCIGIYTTFSKTIGKEDNFTLLTTKTTLFSIILAFFLGFYDGFFGPGTGSFLVFGLIKILKLDFLKASANARVLNFISNITSLVTFAFSGKILYIIGIPVGIFMILGARLGTKVAIKNGVKIIKPLFITMSLAVALKLLINIL